jgi:hypothetical protein
MEDEKLFTCLRCGYKTRFKNNLLAHINKKKTCPTLLSSIPVNELYDLIKKKEESQHKCKVCKKSFSTSSNRLRHEKSCQGDLSQTIQIIQNEIQSLREIVNKNNNIRVVNSNIQTNNNVQQNNVTINLNSFGSENIAHLESDIEYLTQCLLNKDVISLLENIHFDTEHPENRNVRIKNVKKEFMEKFMNGRWIISDQGEILDELLNKGYRILHYFSRRNKSHIIKEYEDIENEYEEMQDWLEDLYSDAKLRNPLKRKLLILFMNDQTLLLEKSE